MTIENNFERDAVWYDWSKTDRVSDFTEDFVNMLCYPMWSLKGTSVQFDQSYQVIKPKEQGGDGLTLRVTQVAAKILYPVTWLANWIGNVISEFSTSRQIAKLCEKVDFEIKNFSALTDANQKHGAALSAMMHIEKLKKKGLMHPKKSEVDSFFYKPQKDKWLDCKTSESTVDEKISSTPDNADPHVTKAKALLLQGDTETADHIVAKQLQKTPDNKELQKLNNRLVKIDELKVSLKEPIKKFETAITDSDRYLHCKKILPLIEELYELGHVHDYLLIVFTYEARKLMRDKQYTVAIPYLTRSWVAATEKPENLMIIPYLMKCNEQIKNDQEVVKWLVTGLNFCKDYGEYIVDYLDKFASQLSSEQLHSHSIAVYEISLKQNSKNIIALLGIWKEHIILEEHEFALQLLITATSKLDQHAQTLIDIRERYRISLTLYIQELIEKTDNQLVDDAIKLLEKVPKEYVDIDLYCKLAQKLRCCKDFNHSLILYNKVLSTKHDHIPALKGKVDALLRLKKNSEALKFCNTIDEATINENLKLKELKAEALEANNQHEEENKIVEKQEHETKVSAQEALKKEACESPIYSGTSKKSGQNSNPKKKQSVDLTATTPYLSPRKNRHVPRTVPAKIVHKNTYDLMIEFICEAIKNNTFKPNDIFFAKLFDLNFNCFNVQLLIHLATELRLYKFYGDSEDVLNLILENDEANTEAKLALAKTYLASDEPRAAKKLIQSLLDDDQNNIVLLYNKAVACHNIEEWVEALQALDYAIKFEPKSEILKELKDIVIKKQKSELESKNEPSISHNKVYMDSPYQNPFQPSRQSPLARHVTQTEQLDVAKQLLYLSPQRRDSARKK